MVRDKGFPRVRGNTPPRMHTQSEAEVKAHTAMKAAEDDDFRCNAAFFAIATT